MILTNCAACAAPLAHNAPRCVRCQTRYCNGLYARTLFEADGASHADVLQAITLLEDASRIVKRVFGPSHPLMGLFQDALDRAKQIKKLKAKLGWLDVS
jgi:hypothetical protein